ncbi:MAG: hypothetical protein K6U03_09285 [Firmicutes bacterium]|nr:hypothetical protein [Bacillota bacterium]
MRLSKLRAAAVADDVVLGMRFGFAAVDFFFAGGGGRVHGGFAEPSDEIDRYGRQT